MKLPPRLRAFAASLLVASLPTIIFPAQQAKTQQPARAGAARTKTDAQQRAKPEVRQRAETADAAEATLDELFGADAYAVYGELRMVGQHFASEEFRQLLEPLKLAGMTPPDVTEMYDFVAAHAEQLAGARLAFGSMPVKPGLPSVVAAVELPSNEEARKFAPQLREFLAKSPLWGEPSEAIEATGGGARETARGRGRRGRTGPAAGGDSAAATRKVAAVKEAALPFHIRQAGAVVALADAPFTFKKLRGAAGAPPLSREAGFAAARSRLAADTVFIYFNTTRMSAAMRRHVEELEREHQRIAEEEQAQQARERDARGGADAPANSPTPTLSNRSSNTSVAVTNVNPATGEFTIKGDIPTGPDGKVTPEGEAEIKARLAEVEGNLAAHEESLKNLPPEKEELRREAERRRAFENRLGDMIFTGNPAGGTWPESVGVGASLDGDSLVVRAFLVGESEDKPPRPIPFMPILHAGPQVASEAANVLPDDTDILVSASLDLPQMYEYVASMFRLLDLAAAATGEAGERGLFDSQVGAIEKQLKFKIREDLISALGNEIAVALPSEMFGVRRARAVRQARLEVEKTEEGATTVDIVHPSSPIVVMALKDKRAVQSLLPRALEAAGVPGVSAEQLLQKQGEAELVTFAGGGVAFIDNFLVVAFDARAMKRIVEAYNEGRTLGRSRRYRDPVDWQPRQVIGQAYVSSALLKEMFGDAYKSADDIDDESLRALLAKLDPEPGAVTLAATRDAAGVTHELHVPRNLLNLWTASSLVGQKLAAQRSNESQALGQLYTVSHAQKMFKDNEGRYGTLEELRRANPDMFAHFDSLSAEGYEIKLTASGDRFEMTATPTGYPKQGRRSFYIDQTGRLRGGDLGGRPASATSDPVDY
ncbi:MAG TPA: hypothetical protein VK421_17075 [Pyrinomonadaceae bacterium]|nr:hypothetical protein [Pyrinomonadaceae bacterium]